MSTIIYLCIYSVISLGGQRVIGFELDDRKAMAEYATEGECNAAAEARLAKSSKKQDVRFASAHCIASPSAKTNWKEPSTMKADET